MHRRFGTWGRFCFIPAAVGALLFAAAGCQTGGRQTNASAQNAATQAKQQPADPGINGMMDKGEYVVAGVPDIRPEMRERMLQYLNVRSAALVDTDDESTALGSILIRTRFGNSAQLHRVLGPRGDRSQLTFFDEPVGEALYVPGSDGSRIILLRDVGGSEDYQVYHLDLATGKTTILSSGKGQHGGLVVARNTGTLAFYGTERNGRDHDIYLCDLNADMKPRRVYEGQGSVTPVEFNPDGSKLLLAQYVSNKVSHVLMMNVGSGAVSAVTPADEAAVHEDAHFSADGQSVFYASDRAGEYTSLYKHDLAGRKEYAITANLPWDVESIAVSPTGNAVVFAVNQDGTSRLYMLETPGGLTYAGIEFPLSGVLGGLRFNHGGNHLCMTFASATSPGDVYTMPFSRTPDTSQLSRWTYSEVGGLDAARFVEPTRIGFPTFDTVNGQPRMIPAYYFKPHPRSDGSGAGAAGQHRFPVVISIHGGPEAQYRPTFSGFVQYLASEMGVAVIAPNVRGSTGYGRTYHTLDDGPLREDSVRDIGGLLDWIGKQPELDAQRVCVFGGSYGGYMVLASLTHYPERIRAGIDIVGIANFVSFLERTRDYRRDLRRREYGDEQDPAMRAILTKISPLTNADRIRSALFVLHGQNDPRVPLFEAQQMVRKQQQAGRPVWFFMAKGEGHGFAKRSNSDLAQVLYAMFIEEHLLK